MMDVLAIKFITSHKQKIIPPTLLAKIIIIAARQWMLIVSTSNKNNYVHQIAYQMEL